MAKKYKVDFCDSFFTVNNDKSYHTINHSSDKNKSLGKLFVSAKVKTKNEELKDILDKLVKFIHSKYLELAHPNAEDCLEEILQQANQHWQQRLSEASISLDDPETKEFFTNLNLSAGILQETTVHFAYVGKANVFLVRQNNVIDILDSMDAEENSNFLKIFGNIITGNLKPGDILFFSFADFIDYFSTEKIKRIVTDYTPKNACDYFQELAKPIEAKKTFSLMIFKVGQREQAPENIKEKPEPKNKPEKQEKETKPTKIHVDKQDSMHELVLKQQKTQDFIKPKIAPKISKNAKKQAGHFFKKILTPLGKLFKKIFSKLKALDLKPKIKEKVNIKFSDNKKNIEKGTPAKSKSIYLPKQNKLYIVLSIIFVVLIAGTIAYSIDHQAKKKQQEEYQKIVSQIEEKQTRVSAAIMYGDNNRAQELLQEIKELIDQVPDNEKFQAEYEKLAQENQEKLDELLKLYKFEPEKIVDLDSDANKLTYLDNKIYAYQNKQITSINPTDKEINDAYKINDDYGNIRLATATEDGNIVAYTDKNKFAKLNLENNSFEELTIDTQNLSDNISSVESYGSRLYVLDSNKNQIYKFQSDNEGGFDEGSPWLEDETDISKLTNISIDGNIWGINPDGTIIKLFGGEKQAYAYEVDPEIEQASKLYTELDWSNLYILEQTSNRIIILNKASGQVVKQYHADSLQNISDVVVDESAGVIYILDNNSVYKLKF